MPAPSKPKESDERIIGMSAPLVLSILLLFLASSSSQAQESSAGGSTSKKGSSFLEGSIKNEASLHSSLEVIPPTPKATSTGLTAQPTTLPGQASGSNYPPFRVNASQYTGFGGSSGAGLGGGTAAGMGRTGLSAGTGAGAGAHSVAPHLIPPISSYTLTPGVSSSNNSACGGPRNPQSGGINGAHANTGANTSGLQGGMGSFPTRVNVPQPPRRQGVTAYGEGYGVSSVGGGGGAGIRPANTVI